MNTEIISAQDPLALRRAHEILQSGGLVAFLAFNGRAVESIYAAKDRPAERSIPVLIGDAEDLAKVSSKVPEIALKLAARFWPGPLTLVVPKHPDLPEAVSSAPTVGVRIPDHAVARALLCLVGPMAVTSANLSGQPNSFTAHEVLAQLGGRITLILDGGKTPGGIPSTVVDCVSAEPQVLRAGPILETEILSVSGQTL
jgi:L-threonylcarbamoyladenylate synthase